MTTQRKSGAFAGYDFKGFWTTPKAREKQYREPYPSDALIAQIEAELGYRLPDSYVELARLCNGGSVSRCC